MATDAAAAAPWVTERVGLGSAIDPVTGWVWSVTATKHNRVWPGTDSPWTFAVEGAYDGKMRRAVGFFTEADCWVYLTTAGHMEADVFSLHGDRETVRREGLRIPDAYVRRG